jgi:hypothetical protein
MGIFPQVLRHQYAAVHALELMILVQIQHVVMMTMAERCAEPS